MHHYAIRHNLEMAKQKLLWLSVTLHETTTVDHDETSSKEDTNESQPILQEEKPYKPPPTKRHPINQTRKNH